MARQPLFSIILCTRNRAELLEQALPSLAAIEVAPADVELLLVDNGSSDRTPQVAARFAADAPFTVRKLLVDRIGLSAARNRAIAEARGTYLFFTDDDQLVDAAVLREHLRVAELHGSRVQQGGIELWVPEGRPWWLYGELAVMLGRTQDVGEGPAAMDLYGGNMLLRRELFAQGLSFREDLGKGAAGYSEDLELTRRLEARGETVVYAPTARIYHVIGADRCVPSFFRRNAFDKGWSDGLMRGASLGLLKLGWRTVTQLGLASAIVTAAWARQDGYRLLLGQIHGAHHLGLLLGAARARRRDRALR